LRQIIVRPQRAQSFVGVSDRPAVGVLERGIRDGRLA
jgi:hypothetical protein